MAELWWIIGEYNLKKWHLNLEDTIFGEKFVPLYLCFKSFLQHHFKLLLILWGFLHVLAVEKRS